MYLANRVRAARALCCCVAAFSTFAYLHAADETTNSQAGPDGTTPAVERSVLNPKTNSPSKSNAAPGLGRAMGPGGMEMGMPTGVAQGPGGGSHDFCKCINESDSDSVSRIGQALHGPLHASGFDFTETPLQQVITQLQDDYGIPIQIDHQALDAIGISPDESVTISVNKISLRAALRLLLKNLQLTYVTTNDVLMITTLDEANKDLRICVYDVSGISGNRDTQLDGVIDTILSCVATDTWAKNGGGEAEIRPIKPGLLVISQTAAVHEEIRDLIATLQKMQSEAKPHQTADRDVKPSGGVVTRSYILAIQPNGSDNVRNQVRELILNSLPNETWSGRLGDGQAVTLNVIHDRVVVRHTPAVQEEVERILTDSGIALPANAVAANANSSGFGGGMGGGGFGGGGGGGGGGGFFRPNDRYRPAMMGAPVPTDNVRTTDPQPTADDARPARSGGLKVRTDNSADADDPFGE